MSHAPAEQSLWQIVEPGFNLENIPVYETLLALGNGYLGMRGTFEEGLGQFATEGTYINGFFESAPIIYGEKFIGFAENKQTILNLANAKTIQVSIGNEPLDLLSGTLLAYQRYLDLRQGILRRSLRWQSPAGKQVQIDVDRFVSHRRKHIALIRYRLTPLNFSGRIRLSSGIDTHIRQSKHAEGDPRLGTQFEGEVLQLKHQMYHADAIWMVHQTVNTGFSVACAIKNVFNLPAAGQEFSDGAWTGYQYDLNVQLGEPVELDKMIAYITSLDIEAAQLVPGVLAELDRAVSSGSEALFAEQREYLAGFWDSADIQIEGDDELQRAIRFNMYHLLQAAGKDGRSNIAAKGLTGLGYEGHYFWDTEVYILPFFLYTQPGISRKLLEYRYHILDKARQRARQMAHPSGALYSWRTIDGEECSANFPTGTAQYHINADIAFAIQRYYDATLDVDFMKRFGVEILCETARLWLEVGDFIPARGGRFCINAVTGPDEYQILVNNNAYTNLMARENLRFASEIASWLKQVDPVAYEDLARRISLSDTEPHAWQKAADLMVINYDEKTGIIPQDDSFLSKAIWDFAGTPPEKYPLLLHYHPLTVMRYQVCKQADTLLAEFLLHDQFSEEQKRRDYAYYEPITTHDSSLSGAIFGILAAELGDTVKAYEYFTETAALDLENRHGNTEAGIHAANMAGAWQGIVFGFAGMRTNNGLSFNPRLPEKWSAYAFRLCYRGSRIQVHVSPEGATFKLLSGDSLEIKVGGRLISLTR